MFLKKILSLTIVFSLLVNQSLFAMQVGDPPVVSCQISKIVEFYPIGDTTGKSVMSKRDVTRDCNVTKAQYGLCLNWENTNESFGQPPESYNSFKSSDFSDSMGTLMATLGAYDQIDHMWSGWKGYCEEGIKSDYSWAEDPMFWASLAMSAVLGSIGGGGSDSVTGAATDVAVDAAVDEAEQTAIDAILEAAEQAMKDLLETVITDVTENMGKCLMAAAFDGIAQIYQYNVDPNGDGECDPIDEICLDAVAATDESDIMTMDSVEFYDMIAEYESSGDNITDQLVIIDDGTTDGIVSFRIKKANEMPGANVADQEAMDEMKQDIKETTAMINAGVTAAALASCLGGYSDATVSVSEPSDDDRASLRQGIGTAIGAISSFLPTPYGMIVGLVGKLILYTATSYDEIDSCSSEEDAKECGSRHEKTQKSLKYDLCHAISRECAETSMIVGENGPLQNSCSLDGYTYCCYDQILTKVLVEQLKAQLGRDWTHCTGISVEDLKYVSLRQCTATEMADGEDGANFFYDKDNCSDGVNWLEAITSGSTPPQCMPDTVDSYQFKHKCVNMGEFLEYLQGMLGNDVEMADLQDYFDDVTDQAKSNN